MTGNWDELVHEAFVQWSASLLACAGLFALIVARLAGLVLVLPGWRSGVVTWRMRAAGVLVLALVTLPLVTARAGAGIDGVIQNARVTGDPASPVTWLARVAVELGVGALMGLGIVAVLAGVRGAGEIVDRQTGWGLAGVLDPGSGEGGGPATRLLVWTAVAMLFVMDPLDGHLLVVESVLESLDAVPPGRGAMVLASGDLAVRLVHQSLLLAVQVAAPVLALMSLVSMATGLIGRTMPETNLLVVAMPARVLASLLVLGLAVSGAGRAVVDVVPTVMEQVGKSLASVSPSG